MFKTSKTKWFVHDFDCVAYLSCKIQYFLSLSFFSLITNYSVERWCMTCDAGISRLSPLGGNKKFTTDAAIESSGDFSGLAIKLSVTILALRALHSLDSGENIWWPYSLKHQEMPIKAFRCILLLFCVYVKVFSAEEKLWTFSPPPLTLLFCFNLLPWMPDLPMSHLGSLQTSLAFDFLNRHGHHFYNKFNFFFLFLNYAIKFFYMSLLGKSVTLINQKNSCLSSGGKRWKNVWMWD